MSTHGRSVKSSRGSADLSRLDLTAEDEKVAIANDERAKLGIDRSALEFGVVRALPAPDVKKIRTSLDLSQSEFAERFGLRVRTIQQWEQGRTVPDLPAQILLTAIAFAPATVSAALSLARDAHSKATKR